MIRKKKEELSRIICCNYAGEGYCGDKSKCDFDCWSGRMAERLSEEGYRRESDVAEEIFAEIEAIIKSCTEEEYSREYGFAPRSWFYITKFKKKLAKLKKV